jgi:hypothetical protein
LKLLKYAYKNCKEALVMIDAKNIKQYVERKNIDIAFTFVILGLLLSAFIKYSWIICILACIFIKEEE